MFALKNETKLNMEKILGIKLDYLDNLTVSEEFEEISNSGKNQRKSSHKISFSSKRDLRKLGRGNPLLTRRRFKTMEDVDKGLDKI